MTRIGIMGGTFDPIHIGHLVAAEEARIQFALDKVIFMPTGRHAFKQDGTTPPEDRLFMTELATLSNPHFEVSRLEIDRPGKTYTIDTIIEMRKLYPDAELYFITGTDAVFEILTWKDSARLADMVIFIAAMRPGYNLEAAKVLHAQGEENFDIRYIEVPALSVSSTELRKRIREGRSVRYLVPANVLSYIVRKDLYGSKRFEK
ncbi:MAG: nicotinate-nucleotide adenylyltransferase [Coriobacteriia bacterium]|nr:nicotinate-nucleotide adenylyltransferase [Coriobacteriia bacterium]